MNLSPTVRTILTAVGIAIAAFGGLVAAGEVSDLPEWVGIALAVLSPVFGYLGIVPPQVGGTQNGVFNPGVTEPPAADINEAGGVR